MRLPKNHPNQGKKIDFFITSDSFPSISVTGNSCSHMCQHCKGKLLQRLIHATTCEELEKKALELHARGANGILLTGGCDERGSVPIRNIITAIKNIKEIADLIIIAHTGINTGEEAELLKDSGPSRDGFQVLGDMAAAKE